MHGFYLDLKDTVVVSSFKRNLIQFPIWTNLDILVLLEIIKLICL